MDLLRTGATSLGIQLNTDQVEMFERYYETLIEWCERVNLTAIVDKEEVQRRLFLESLTVAQAIPSDTLATGRFADLGSGGGFPGVPLKIAFPAIGMTLIEATRKKAAFLRHLVDVLRLHDVDVMAERAESLAHRPAIRETFDCVLVRAVASMSTLAELALPLCRLGGVVVAQKSLGVEPEIDAAAGAIQTLGGDLKEVREVAGVLDPRLLVVLEKRRPTPERYPRRPGMPAKRPLERPASPRIQ